jgi:hypothetical protein
MMAVSAPEGLVAVEGRFGLHPFSARYAADVDRAQIRGGTRCRLDVDAIIGCAVQKNDLCVNSTALLRMPSTGMPRAGRCRRR